MQMVAMLVAAATIVMVVVFGDFSGKAMERCLENHSFDTCASTIR